MEYVLAVVAGYLLGSIPVALLVARHHGIDLYRTADGNPGAWNALAQLGPRRALPAFAGCLAVTAASGVFAVGARVGVSGFPLVQLALYPAEQVAATGGLMSIIGALFVLRRGRRVLESEAQS